MALIVQKFGGTSVADLERIKYVAEIIASTINDGHQVITVVSAMAGATNELVNLCSSISSLKNDAQRAEYDTALSTGEMLSASLLALALQAKNIPARSVTAWQLPMITTNNYSKALVQSLDTILLQNCLKQGIVPVVCGFQGITNDARLTTLGRGGSDTTAALVAAAMQADSCDIYTDVPGVLTADPRVVSNAKLLQHIDFEIMLELASSGAKVLHPRSVEIAMRYDINLRVLTSFNQAVTELGITKNGTLINNQLSMENTIINAVTSNKHLLYFEVKLKNQQQAPMQQSLLCQEFLRNGIHIELMLPSADEQYVSFITPLYEQAKIIDLLDAMLGTQQIELYNIKKNLGVISILGRGIKHDPEILQLILEILHGAKIQILMLQSLDIKINILVQENEAENAVRLLHSALIDN